MLSFITRLQDFTFPHGDATDEKRATVVVNLSALSGKHGGEARVSEFSKWKFFRGLMYQPLRIFAKGCLNLVVITVR